MATTFARGAGSAWVRCPACATLVYGRRLERALRVCPECRHHFRLPAPVRARQLFDPGSFERLDLDVGATDVLGFADTRPYPERLADARERTGSREAAVSGMATIAGQAVVAVLMEFGFIGGSMGAAVGEIVTGAVEEACRRRTPLLLVTASGGARMQEGCISLMQMAKTSQAMAELRERGVPSICLLTDPTFGGVTASFASLCDVLVAEAGSLLGFAGPQVIEKTIRQRLPDGFQTAEYLFARGMLDLVEQRDNLRPLLGRLLGLYLPVRALPRCGEGRPLLVTPPPLERPAWETVRLARDLARPTALDYLTLAFDDFQELHGDRLHGDDAAIVGGPARLAGVPVMVLAQQKGHDTAELLARNFGMPHPEGYRKAQRLMDQAERLRLPLVTLVDTPGAYPGVAAEERGQAGSIAESILRMSRLTVPAVTAITGEGGSGGALALAVGNHVLGLENAFYSVISPEGCAVILCGDPARAPAMAGALRLTAPDLLRLGVIDGIVPEPPGGAQADPAAAAANLKRALADSLAQLLPLAPAALREQRRVRFRYYGVADEQRQELRQAAGTP